MNKKIIQNFAWWGGILIVSFGLIPFLINVIGTNVAIKSGASFSDWLSFWGSYLGGFVTLIGVYVAFKLDNKKEIQKSAYLNLELLTDALGILEYIWRKIDDDDLTTLDLGLKREQLIQISQKVNTLHPSLQFQLREIESKVWTLYNYVQIDESYIILKEHSMVDQEDLEENKRCLEIKAEEVRQEIVSFRRTVIDYKVPL